MVNFITIEYTENRGKRLPATTYIDLPRDEMPDAVLNLPCAFSAEISVDKNQVSIVLKAATLSCFIF